MLGAIVVSTLCLACANGSDSIAEEDAARILAESYCHHWFACGCNHGDPPEYADEAACVAERTATLESTLGDGRDSGLEFDPSCVAEVVARNDERGCEEWEETSQRPVAELCEGLCAYYHGDNAVGESCTGSFGVSECAAGLWCNETCYEPCSIYGGPAVGEPCDGQQCGGADTYCDFVDPDDPSTWTCREQKDLGEPCRSLYHCLSAACEDGICVEGGPTVCGFP